MNEQTFVRRAGSTLAISVIAIAALVALKPSLPAAVLASLVAFFALLPAVVAMLEKIGLLDIILARAPQKTGRWFVYGELTPFYDRWAGRHTRPIMVTKSYHRALLRAWSWSDFHPHGSAFVSARRIHAAELGWSGNGKKKGSVHD